MLSILNSFQLDAPAISCEKYGCGHINMTYLVVTATGRRYILQKINDRIFQNVPALMENIAAVTGYLAKQTDDPRKVLTLVSTLDGKPYLQQEGYWRVYDFVEDCIKPEGLYVSWQTGGSSYYRVVDYKTGRKDFDYCDVFNGVGLQMLLYLFALRGSGDPSLGYRPVPAGVQYFPARAPYLPAEGMMDDVSAEKERKPMWKRKGLLLEDEAVLQAMEPGEPVRMCYTVRKDGSYSGDLADRDQLKLLERYVFHILGHMVEEIASGSVEANPYTRGSSHNACAFCPYGSICHQETVEGRRNYKTMTAQRFWEEVGKEMR